MKSLEEYLKQVHAEGYEGTDDDMPDDFDTWFSNLDAQEMFDFAQAWGKGMIDEVLNDVKAIKKILN